MPRASKQSRSGAQTTPGIETYRALWGAFERDMVAASLESIVSVQEKWLQVLRGAERSLSDQELQTINAQEKDAWDHLHSSLSHDQLWTLVKSDIAKHDPPPEDCVPTKWGYVHKDDPRAKEALAADEGAE